MRRACISLLCLVLLQAWQAQAATAQPQQGNPKSCIDTTTTAVYNLTLSNNFTFEVLCNSDITDPGWTVIQQRVRGGVDFYRNWTSYRNGFGDFWDGDFFLGLEKIHRLTNEQPHKLYIYMKRCDGSALIARYDEFAISGESDGYRITKLGKFGGNTLDRLKIHKDVRFSTYDRDNDEWDMNCAVIYHNAWWNKFCYNCNLNGVYFNTEVDEDRGIYWEPKSSLKQVWMMIQPKGVTVIKEEFSYFRF